MVSMKRSRQIRVIKDKTGISTRLAKSLLVRQHNELYAAKKTLEASKVALKQEMAIAEDLEA